MHAILEEVQVITVITSPQSKKSVGMLLHRAMLEHRVNAVIKDV